MRGGAVQAARGLVREQQQWLRDEFHGDGHALALAARDTAMLGRAHAGVVDRAQVEVLEHTSDDRLQLLITGSGGQTELRLEYDVLLDRELAVEDIILWHEACDVAQKPRILGHLPPDLHRARDLAIGGPAAEHREEGGLPAARWSHDSTSLARQDSQADVLQQRLAIVQAEVDALQQKRHAALAWRLQRPARGRRGWRLLGLASSPLRRRGRKVWRVRGREGGGVQRAPEGQPEAQ
mmetsp:Transcript_90790/g.259736  ORF Transcript_90790/g.259736 Transcript_90790/m.259736 type:complete len:237 (-) Transcript_90790:947-1657(-)